MVKERIRAPVKDSFVGAPMRSSQQAPPSRHKQLFDLENEDEVFFEPAKTKTGGDAATYKGSIDFQVFINEIGMQKLRDKVAASSSIVLTKAQRTRLAVAKKSE